MTADARRRTADDGFMSLVTQHVRRTLLWGWLVFALGAVWDLAYHAPTILIGVQWPPAIDSTGEFGHVITFVGAVIVIFSILRKHERAKRS